MLKLLSATWHLCIDDTGVERMKRPARMTYSSDTNIVYQWTDL